MSELLSKFGTEIVSLGFVILTLLLLYMERKQRALEAQIAKTDNPITKKLLQSAVDDWDDRKMKLFIVVVVIVGTGYVAKIASLFV